MENGKCNSTPLVFKLPLKGWNWLVAVPCSRPDEFGRMLHSEGIRVAFYLKKIKETGELRIENNRGEFVKFDPVEFAHNFYQRKYAWFKCLFKYSQQEAPQRPWEKDTSDSWFWCDKNVKRAFIHGVSKTLEKAARVFENFVEQNVPMLHPHKGESVMRFDLFFTNDGDPDIEPF